MPNEGQIEAFHFDALHFEAFHPDPAAPAQQKTRRARTSTLPGLKSFQFLVGCLAIQHPHRCAAKPQVVDNLQMLPHVSLKDFHTANANVG